MWIYSFYCPWWGAIIFSAALFPIALTFLGFAVFILMDTRTAPPGGTLEEFAFFFKLGIFAAVLFSSIGGVAWFYTRVFSWITGKQVWTYDDSLLYLLAVILAIVTVFPFIGHFTVYREGDANLQDEDKKDSSCDE